MNARTTGVALMIVGVLAQVAGIAADLAGVGDDTSLRDLTTAPHALLFAGIAVALMGLLLALVGPVLYRPATVSAPRRLLQVGAPVAALVLVAGCAAATNETESASAGADRVASGASSTTTPHDMSSMDHSMEGMDHSMEGMDHGDGGDHHGAAAGEVIVGSADGSSPCEIALPMPSSPGQVGTGEGGSTPDGAHGHRGMVRQEALTKDERVQLAEQMVQARTVVQQFPTVKEAEAAGYGMSTTYVPCIGAHYTNPALAVTFDPARPSELLFDGTDPDSKLVGLSYLVWHPGGAPEGFAGPNDRWHQHNSNGGLCLRNGVVLGGESISAEDCAARGGAKRELKDIWMAHAWVVPGWECSWGVFSGECPELGGRVGGTAWDEPVPDDDSVAGQG